MDITCIYQELKDIRNVSKEITDVIKKKMLNLEILLID